MSFTRPSYQDDFEGSMKDSPTLLGLFFDLICSVNFEEVKRIFLKLVLFKTLSAFNKTFLPKMWSSADLSNLSKKEKLILGWKRYVTFTYLELKEKAEK